MNLLVDIREYDVPYIQRVCIDRGVRVGLWFDVIGVQGSMGVDLKQRDDLEMRPLMRTLAFDIETTKLPLKFPDAEFDKVMMISYMLDNQGYLIVNREVDFSFPFPPHTHYTPRGLQSLNPLFQETKSCPLRFSDCERRH